MDVEHFKPFNDQFGHQAGDICLSHVGQALLACKRRAPDLVARYGEEEFVCVLPGSTEAGAKGVAEKLREVVSSLGIPQAKTASLDYVIISVGVVARTLPQGENSTDLLIQEADQALYLAKSEGRNRVVMHREGTEYIL